jgi:type I restriction enzyme, S subunit
VLRETVQVLEESCGLRPLPRLASPAPFSCTSVQARSLQRRCDAFFHSPYCSNVLAALRAADVGTKTLRSIADAIVEPPRFKRVRVDGGASSVRFFGTSALMWSEPVEMYRLPSAQPGIEQYIVDENTVLIPRSGQLSGIIGTAVLPFGDVIGSAVSEDAIRVRCQDAATAGFVLVALTSQYGLRQLKARAYGSSIPHLDTCQIGEVVLPVPEDATWRSIGDAGARLARLRHEAIAKEREARTLLERAIEEAA